MNVLVISQWYKPEPDGRVSALAEGLVKKGHQVTVVTGFPNYPQGKLYDGYRIRWRQWDEINGVKVLRLPLFPDHSRSVVKRALNYLSFSLALIFLAPWFIRKPDVIWAYTALVGLPTFWISRLFRVPYVMEIADIWPDTLTATGMLKKGFFVNLLDCFGRYVYNSAAALIVQNPGFKPCLVGKGVEEDKIHVVKNWADEDIYMPMEYDHKLADQYGLSGKFNVMFAGALGMAQGLDTIVEAARLCCEMLDVQFVLIGDGSCLLQTKALVEKYRLENVKFIGRKPATDMPVFFAIADVLLVHLRDEAIFEIILPGKTQSYLACGRPVIMAKRGDGVDLITKHLCGVSCEPASAIALSAAVRKIHAMIPKARMLMGENGRELYLAQFTKAGLLNKIETVLEGVM